ncbi:MAG: hypothetical protein HY231_23870 [Acidobacteria bacterium]|nr:hypothetical protein [Acidobacteriota bacterium]
MTKLYDAEPVQRLVDVVLPRTSAAVMNNPVLQALRQLDEFGWKGCTPQHRNLKMRQSFSHLSNAALVEHIAHAKRFIMEHVRAYIDGFLPTILRKIKYAIDKVKIIRYIIRLVATLNYLSQLIAHEIALANQWARENLLNLEYAINQVSPAHLRTAAERELVSTLNRAKSKIEQQIVENTQMLTCLV